MFQGLLMKPLIWVCLFGVVNVKSTSANFDTENAKLVDRKPVFILEFSGLTRKYCTGTFNNITANHKKLISSVSFSPTGISIPKNNIRLGRAEFVVVNESLDVSDLVTQNNLHKLAITIKFGFQALDDTDFISFDKWAITDINPKDAGTEFVFVCQDASRLATKDIFNFDQKTGINGEDTGVHDTVVVDSTTGFIDPTIIPSEILNYMAVGILASGQNIGYRIIDSATQFGNSISPNNVVGRIPTGTENQVLEDNATVLQTIFFRDIKFNDPDDWGLGKMILHILLTTDDASGHAFYDLANYDSNFKGFGVGMTSNEVNIDEIENFEGLISVNSIPYGEDDLGGRVHITNGEPRNALEFLSEFLNSLGAYFYMGSDGKWTIGTYDSSELISSFGSVVDFTEADTIDFQYSIDWNKLINQIDFEFNLSISGSKIGGFTDKKVTIKLDESVTDYGANEKNFEIKNDLPQATVSNDFLQYCYARRWLYTFGNPPANFNFNSKTKNIIYDPGDHVLFSLDEEVDMTGASSSKGWSDKKAILTSQNILLAKGVFDVKYAGVLFDVFDKVSGFHTDTTFSSGDMNDSTLDPTGSNATALESADAYIDVATPTMWDAFRFKIQWTNPNNGTNLYNLFAVAIHVQTTAGPTDLFTVIVQPSMVYFTGNSDTVTRSFFCVDQSLQGTNVERIKIDIFDLRETDDTVVAAGDRPSSMTVTQIIATELNKTISVV